MSLRSLALAIITLAGSTIAQCGTNALTTPVGFTSSGTTAGGACLYFQLNVLNPNGIQICGIDVNTRIGAGQHIAGTIHRHLTLTDPFLLTSANLTAANWATLCGFRGTSAAQDIPSPTTIVDGSGTLDLAPGPHLLCMNACYPLGLAVTTAGGPALTSTDGNLTYYGGCSTTGDFFGAPFGTTANAPVINATFRYTLPTGTVATTPGGFASPCASTVSTGSSYGCGATAVGMSVRQEFPSTPDLIVPASSSEDVLFTTVGMTVTTVTMPGSPIVSPASPNLGLYDDENTPLIPMGFVATMGGPPFEAISMSSNGYIWLGLTGTADYTPTGAELVAGTARVCPYWFDFAPNRGGTTHVDVLPGLVRVTWLNCWGFTGNGPEGTVQAEITPSTVLFRYDPNGGAWTSSASARLIGFTNGVGHPDPGQVNLNGGAVPPVTGAWQGNLVLATVALPYVGGTGIWRVSNMQYPNGIAGILAEIGAAGSAVPLPSPPFATGCYQYLTPAAVAIGLFFGSMDGSTSISIPPGPTFMGLPIALQAAGIGGPAFATSNAISAIIGL
jgi:hypothetical protein